MDEVKITKKEEDTPFVIDFRQKKQHNYGSATHSGGGPSSSAHNNNNSVEDSAQMHQRTSSQIYCLHGQKNIEVRDHCHRQRSEGVDVKARKKLIIASALCLFFMICEIFGGILSNSLAIATDAAHLLTDFASFMISLFAIWIAGRPSTQRMSFGWYRAEVIGALASVLMIWIITGILVWLAVERIIYQDFELNASVMLITSGLAIIVNIIMGVQLQHGHSHGFSSGHSHEEKKSKKTKGKVADPVDLTLMQAAEAKRAYQSTDSVLETPRSSRVSLSIPIDSQSVPSVPACELSPNGRIEDGVGADLAAADAQIPPVGLKTFSYQNTRSINEVNAEIAAVMAETSVAAHHHGGPAAKEAVNMNVRAAFIHVLGDMMQSVGVFVAALVIYFKPEWSIADPICTFAFSIIVLCTTFFIMKDALLVLMEGTPNYMHYAEVLEVFKQIDGVERVHNLRIWALSINKIALSVHLAIAPNVNPKTILEEATTAVHKRYNFFETTIQIEDYSPNMENCTQCSLPER